MLRPVPSEFFRSQMMTAGKAEQLAEKGSDCGNSQMLLEQYFS